MSDKYCPNCALQKPLSDFGVDKHRVDGHNSRCRECIRERELERKRVEPEKVRTESRIRMARWRVANPENYRHNQLARYGLSIEEYTEMHRRQNGLCAICSQPETRSGVKWLAVDHDHATGAVRGLLCDRCNVGLGRFNDDPDLLRSALDYLVKEDSIGISRW